MNRSHRQASAPAHHLKAPFQSPTQHPTPRGPPHLKPKLAAALAQKAGAQICAELNWLKAW